ncbi:LysE family translocator [Nonomuraea sp. NPDC050536]|uniref:LysE family translocator n=1 Tax=Nonomuraea sp. NPDC050536 TaxID=3364366 RepID=UPI0037CB4343
MISSFLAFLGVSVLVIVTPGPDTAVTVSAALGGGRRGGVFTALGVSCGQALWTLAASAGVAALLVASEPAFLAVKYVGAAYLMYLGVHAIWSACRHHAVPTQQLSNPAERRGKLAYYRRGLLSDLGNPKMAVFFTSLLPQFGSTFAELAGLGLVFSAMTFGWLACYAVAVDAVGEALRRGPVRRAIDAVTGAVLIGLGLRLATEQR